MNKLKFAFLFTFSFFSLMAGPEETAIDAYIYGYPLVTMDVTREVMTNTVKPGNDKAPMGQFYHATKYPDASFKSVTAPNADTLYSLAWLDLEKEPYILHVPEESDRYYLMPMLSGWTDVFASPGTRTTGTGAGDFAVVGPNFVGDLPNGVKRLDSPTNLVWILGRTYSSGTPDDFKTVHEIQSKYSLTPLSSYGKTYSPPEGVVNPAIDTKTAVRDQVNNMEGRAFFKRLAELLIKNPPSVNDKAVVEKIKEIGIIPGQSLADNLNPEILKSLDKAPKIALEKIRGHEKNAGKITNGWITTNGTGNYGIDYLQRAFVAFFGLGANLPQDAIYPVTHVDNKGEELNGKNKYTLTFEKGQLPPVKGFWSLTMYNGEYFFVENPLNRFTLSPRDKLIVNEDGSRTFYIQNESPGADKEANWLPAPAGPFVLMFRFYWPEPAIIDGSWSPPPVVKSN